MHLKLTDEWWPSRNICLKPFTYKNDSQPYSQFQQPQVASNLESSLSQHSVNICHPTLTSPSVGAVESLLVNMSWPWAGLGALHLLSHFFLSLVVSQLLVRLSGVGCVTRVSEITVPSLKESTLNWESVWYRVSIFPQRTWSNWYVPTKRFHYCLNEPSPCLCQLLFNFFLM